MNEKQTNEQQIFQELTSIFLKLDEISAQIAKIPKSNQQQLPNNNPQMPQPETVFPPKKQYPTTCAVCGQDCTVPFPVKPGSRVKCMDCYLRQKNGQ